MNDLLSLLFAAESMEDWFSTMIMVMDKIETRSHTGVSNGYIGKDMPVQIAQIKQELIDRFAAVNRETTLKNIEEKYA